MRQKQFVISLGGNIGDVKETFYQVIMQMELIIGQITNKSNIYKTQAWGNTNQPDFLNQVVVLNSTKSISEVFFSLQELEKKYGRFRHTESKWAPRTIDLDILFVDDTIVKTESLTIPHNLLHNRLFVLTPLTELMPNFVHPVLKVTLQTLLNACTDNLSITKL